jgi:hypothetical protein
MAPFDVTIERLESGGYYCVITETTTGNARRLIVSTVYSDHEAGTLRRSSSKCFSGCISRERSRAALTNRG